MKRSGSRIVTTHVGSLVRPPESGVRRRRKDDGRPCSDGDRAILARHVAEGGRMQAECGIDIPSDGEYSKSGFAQYITDRLTGFEVRNDLPGRGGGTTRSRDRRRFAEAYREIEGGVQGGTTSMANSMCTGPITYRGSTAAQTDIVNFSTALQGRSFEEAFIPAVAPGTIELQRANHFYKTEEDYLYALADSMKVEYRMIVDAGCILL